MIRFYFHPTPNPVKVALLLEEVGAPYRDRAGRHRQGRAAQVGFPRRQS